MCVGSQGGGTPPNLNTFRGALRQQEGRDPTDTFSQDIRGTASGRTTRGASGFGPVREAGATNAGSIIAALRSRRSENSRIESGLLAGTLGGRGSSALAPTATANPIAREDPSLVRARQRRGSTFLS